MCYGLPCFCGTPEQLRVAVPRHVQHEGSIDYLNANMLYFLPFISRHKALKQFQQHSVVSCRPLPIEHLPFTTMALAAKTHW